MLTSISDIIQNIFGCLLLIPESPRTFVDMGVDELSVSPVYVLELRKAIREI